MTLFTITTMSRFFINTYMNRLLPQHYIRKLDITPKPKLVLPKITFDPSKKDITMSPKAKLGGMAKAEVIDSKTGKNVDFKYGDKYVRETPWVHNLILNNYLNHWFDDGTSGMAFLNLEWDMNSLRVGFVNTGSDANKYDSGTITASQTGTTITLSEPFPEMLSGRIIKWDSGEWSVINSGSGTTWTAAQSKSVSSNEFSVYATERTSLTGSSGKYVDGSGSRGSMNIDGSSYVQFVYTFNEETANINYNEFGVGHDGSYSNRLFSRVLFPSSITVLEDQQLRVTYRLNIQVGPIVDTPSNIIASGVSIGTAFERHVYLRDLNGSMYQDRHVRAYHMSQDTLHPLTTSSVNLSNDVDIVNSNCSISTVPNTYKYTCSREFSVSQMNLSDIKSIYIGDKQFGCELQNTFTKSDTHKLTLGWTVTIEPELV